MVVGNPVAADHRVVAPQVFDLYVAPANGGRHTTHLRCSSLLGQLLAVQPGGPDAADAWPVLDLSNSPLWVWMVRPSWRHHRHYAQVLVTRFSYF
jgi:hypothetical protein